MLWNKENIKYILRLRLGFLSGMGNRVRSLSQIMQAPGQVQEDQEDQEDHEIFFFASPIVWDTDGTLL